MKKIQQRGSTHAIIIVILVVALLGVLGVVFYQNFIANKSTSTTTQDTTTQKTIETVRMAFESKIYAFDYPKVWSVVSESTSDGANATTLMNPDKTIRVKLRIAGGGIGGNCDPTSPRKVRFYNVYPTAVTKLSDAKAYVVEAMTDAEGGGYNYTIGLTQDGGDTHAALGDPFCTVAYVGVASRLVLDTETGAIVQPTIFANIDFPKMAAGTDMRVREMQQVKDILATDDYKAAVKILESARKE